jgi:hypothetical protein
MFDLKMVSGRERIARRAFEQALDRELLHSFKRQETDQSSVYAG